MMVCASCGAQPNGALQVHNGRSALTTRVGCWDARLKAGTTAARQQQAGPGRTITQAGPGSGVGQAGVRRAACWIRNRRGADCKVRQASEARWEIADPISGARRGWELQPLPSPRHSKHATRRRAASLSSSVGPAASRSFACSLPLGGFRALFSRASHAHLVPAPRTSPPRRRMQPAPAQLARSSTWPPNSTWQPLAACTRRASSPT